MTFKTGGHSHDCQAQSLPVLSGRRYRRVMFEVGDLAGRIRQMVDASGLSDRAFATRCKLNPNILSTLLPRLRANPYAVELKTLAALARGGGTTIRALLFPELDAIARAQGPSPH